MKFLLAAINAKYIHSNPAIYSLRAYAGEELRDSIMLGEYTINQSMGEILGDIYLKRPDAVGFSCYIWNWRLVEELVEELPKLLPETDIWLGGPQATFDAPEILKRYGQITGIMVGEGEVSFRELMKYYVQGKEGNRGLEQCPGLCLREGYTAPAKPADMSGLPFLYEDLEPFSNKIIYYESSRGCPYRCSYCLSSIDKRVRLRDIHVVKRELQFFLDHKVKQVKFVDRTFNCDHEHALAIWRYLQEHDNGITNFHFEISADILKEEEIQLLNNLRPGLVQLEIGVQSVNPRTLEAIHRRADMERLESAVEDIRKGHRIHQHLDLIAGLPFEDYESFAKSFDKVYSMKPHQFQLGFLKVLKGSAMYEDAKGYGIRYMSRPPYEVLCTDWLSYEEILRLKGIEEMVEVYYNSGQYSHTLAFLEKAFEGPFVMYETLAGFYKAGGYFLKSPARAERFRILLDFAECFDGENLPVYRELMTYDMYLRENLKSRPDFTESREEFRESMRNFYIREEKERSYLPDYGKYDWKQMSKMTHMEPFFYQVWDPQGVTCRRTRPAFVLFDYQRRNPLNKEARTILIEKPEEAFLERK